MLIKQSDKDLVVLEAITDNIRIILASMYLDINWQIHTDMQKIEAISHAKGAGVLIGMDTYLLARHTHQQKWKNDFGIPHE
jgi:hypothetical protein